MHQSLQLWEAKFLGSNSWKRGNLVVFNPRAPVLLQHLGQSHLWVQGTSAQNSGLSGTRDKIDEQRTKPRGPVQAHVKAEFGHLCLYLLTHTCSLFAIHQSLTRFLTLSQISSLISKPFALVLHVSEKYFYNTDTFYSLSLTVCPSFTLKSRFLPISIEKV